MLELPLFFSYLSPENVFSPPRSIMVGEFAILLSRFSGDLPVFGQHSESDQVGTSLCIEPDTPEPLSGTDFPGCLPLPEGSESVFVSIDGGDSNPQQTVMLLPVNPINTAIPESDGNTSVMPLSCDQEACVAWNYEGRVRVLDLSETTLPGESVSAEMKARKIWVVVQTVDQNGNIIYQWYDQDGHLHTISEWEFKRRLSMRFQSLLEFLYPEYFGPSFPAGGGWHQWQYWKVRRAADRPENTGQQRWPARQSRHPPNGKKVRSGATVNSVQKVGFTKYQPRHQNGRPQRPPTGRGIERTVENEIDTLLREFNLGYMQRIANKYNENYDGKKHRQFCSKIKNATKVRKKSLTDSEKLRFVPFMDHLSSVVYSFDGISLSTCIHSLTASQLFYPPRSTRGKSAVSDDGDREVKEAQTALIRHFITAVKSQVQRQEGAPNGFDGQAISNLLWALAKLVESGLLKLDQRGLASQTVTALLPQVVTPPGPFNSQHVSNLLWALAKLVESGLLKLDQGGLASQTVTALLPQVVTPPGPFKPQEISNLLWALAKLVESGLLKLDQRGLASQAVTALLPQVVTPPGPFKPQEISNLLWALAKLVESGLLKLDQRGLASQAVTALLPQVVTPPGPFKPQEISNLLWALAKLVESGLLKLDQGGLASQAVTALLPQVVTPPGPFNPQEISNLLWALAKLVESGLLKLDQGGLASQAVTALLPQVVTPPGPFKPQEISNLLWALAKLVESGLLKLDQGGLASQAVTALLPQVQSHQDDFTSQEVSNLLWALAKLVESGLLKLDQGGLASQAVTALLPQVVTPPGPFKPQEISSLLWALAKLVESGLLKLDQGGLASQAVTALLPQVVTPPGPFKPQEISSLLWVLAKLVESGLLKLDQGGLASQSVTALLPQVVTPPGPFKPQEISSLLWALATLGEGISLNEIPNMLKTMGINTIEYNLHQEMTLWALTVFLARGVEISLLLPPMKTLYDALMAEKGNTSDIRATIMRLSGIWLGENLRDLPLHNYRTTVSQPHRELYTILRERFPRHTLEVEASVDGLPPVDLLFSREKVVVEVQGAHHYVDKEKNLSNGSTILKVSTYRKLGYKVLEVPASDVTSKEKQEELRKELSTYFSNKGNSADSSTGSDGSGLDL